MSRISKIITIIAVIFFDDTTSDCINGTPYGCNDGRICFLNQCFESSGSCTEGNCSFGFICVNYTCLDISKPATSATIFTTTTGYATITIPIQTTTSECVDLHVPGRASDCSQARYLCSNIIYYALMTEQCPFTCNRCSACFDQVGPDGTSNCASVAYLCRNSLYRRLMNEQCPQTCGYCK